MTARGAPCRPEACGAPRGWQTLATTLFLLAALSAARAAPAPSIPAPRGFVTDDAGVIDAATRAKLDALLTELQQKTGAEIAVLTVNSTAPLDDFTYAMQVADQWKVGKKGADSGVLMVVAVQDRKIRVLTGYGVEGVLPDGLVGAIEDQEMLPSFRSGNVGDGIWRGVAAFAQRIAADRGVTLSGMPAPRAQPAPVNIPPWLFILLVMLAFIVMAQLRGRGGRRGGGGPVILPGGFGGGGGGFPGGFGGGGGGFGGFGGGGFGGGGAGRSW